MSAPSPLTGKRAATSDHVIVCLMLALGVLALVAWRQRSEINRLNLQPALTSGLSRETPARTLAVVPVRPLLNEPDSKVLDAPALSDPPEGARAAGSRTLAELLENPEFRRAFGLHRQASLDARFAGLFRQLELSSGELEVFKRLLVEKENVALDVLAVSETLPDGPLDADGLKVGVATAREQVEAAIRNSLGSDRYALYRDYVATLPQRTIVAQLEQRLSYTAAPLLPAQSDSLLHILVAQAPATPPASTPATAMVLSPGTPSEASVLQPDGTSARVTDAALAQSSAVLAPPQLAALHDIQVEQQALQTAFQLLQSTLAPQDKTVVSWLQPLMQ